MPSPCAWARRWGWAGALAGWRRALAERVAVLYPIGFGGNAVGTGINAHPDFPRLAVEGVAERTGLPFRLPDNMFTFIQNLDAVLEVSGLLRGLATALGKIANDVRLLSSGPRAGLAELKLPAVQPGSSIMPGKVNPVMAEMLNMVGFQVLGHDAAVQAAVGAAQLELNVMMPVVAYNLLMAVTILANAVQAFTTRALEGLEADPGRIGSYVEMNTALATALNPYLGYDRAAEVAKAAYAEGKSVRQVVLERGLLPAAELDRILDPARLAGPETVV
ncbi:putative Fumarate hydratase [Candidatus Hydrogenisulfobacillus filiaventi]|uniref:aspartate ammonia-lyase n=1 Tax=Candidatus Hydrogenisulfobacillus filiaventi TaxID=2707344 RepID=A0A6F8ZEV6_9FIRM|nr:putative Fumarate hydratase [Candidatus Hydrogenisulfobacillus filiaventi]